MDAQLETLCSNVRKIWYGDIPDLLICVNPVWLGFATSHSKFEDLEVVICNWKIIMNHAGTPLGAADYDNYWKYGKIYEVFNILSLKEINLEQLIMSSGLSQLEKEYLKLKYFV